MNSVYGSILACVWIVGIGLTALVSNEFLSIAIEEQERDEAQVEGLTIIFALVCSLSTFWMGTAIIIEITRIIKLAASEL